MGEPQPIHSKPAPAGKPPPPPQPHLPALPMSPIATGGMYSQAEDLLYGFDIPDDGATREFLSSLITSGHVPVEDMRELRRASILRGMEEWDMVLSCAGSIRSEVLGAESRTGSGTVTADDEPGLIPFLAYVLSGEAAEDATRKAKADAKVKTEPTGKARSGKAGKAGKARGKRAVSRFWDDELGDIPVRRDGRGDGTRPLASIQEKGKRRRRSSIAREENLPESKMKVTATRARTDKPSEEPEDPSPATNPDPASSLGIKAEDFQRQPPPDTTTSPSKPTRSAKSPYFTPPIVPSPSPSKKPRPPRGTISSLPIPPLSAPCFGLIQEELASNPFQLLVAVTLLIRTTGKAAIPTFRRLVDRFPTAEALAEADSQEVIPLIRHLGLSVVRCAAVQRYARTWVERPPRKGVRYGVKNYPRPGDGKGVRVKGEYGPENGWEDSLSDGDGLESGEAGGKEVSQSAWEIGHLTQGPYVIDSWRIFCRDVLLGRADDWTGKGREPTFQPEWMRVLPADKELRACLRWMWMREGWEWDPVTGDRVVLREEMRRAVDEGRVGYDDRGGLVILERPMVET